MASCFKRIVIALLNPFRNIAYDPLAAVPGVYYIGQQLAVVEFDIRPHGVECKLFSFNLRPMHRARRDRNRMTAPFQFRPHRQVRVQVAKRAESRDQNARQSSL
jgi:hypothetical protein